YLSDPDIFGDVHAAELPLVNTLCDQMRALPAHHQLYVPLTIGHHVDHQLTRIAAERAFAPSSLVYYEDYPYAQKPDALAGLIPATLNGWQATVIALDEAAIQAKIAAIAAFASQFSTFFTDQADLEAQIRTFTTQTGGERVWRTTSA